MHAVIRPFPRLASVPLLTLTLLCSFVYLAPGHRLRAVAAQSSAPSGSFGFLITSSFKNTSADATGVAILGVMNFDGAGNVTGSYTYEVDARGVGAPKTTAGAFTGTYTPNADGTGSVTMALDAGLNLTLGIVAGDGGQTLQLVATDFQFPAAKCYCIVGSMVLAGTARAMPAAALSGSYGFQILNAPNVNASFGVAKFDGAGNVAVSFTFVSSSDATGKPTAPIGIAQGGTYSINADGTGSINLGAVPGVSNAQTYAIVTTDNGSGLFLVQTDRPGSGVAFGAARLQ